jgi:hypothetical protein
VHPAPLRGSGALAVLEQARGVTGLTPAALHSPSHSGGDGLLPGELVWRHRGTSLGRMMAPSHRCQALNARVRGPAHAWGAPSSVADPGRGRDVPSSEAEPARGGVSPRAGRSPLEGSAAPRTGRSPPEGARVLERGGACFEGISKRAALMGRRGPCGVGRVLHG